MCVELCKYFPSIIVIIIMLCLTFKLIFFFLIIFISIRIVHFLDVKVSATGLLPKNKIKYVKFEID